MNQSARRDDRPRRTPYELVFGTEEFETRLFPRIREEAAEREVEPEHLERFGFLSIAADAVRAVVPPDAPPEALDQYRALLFHAFNLWRYGKHVYSVDAALARYLVEAAPAMTDWEFRLPHTSVYLQMPVNLFWSSISADSTPEPIDGFFVTTAWERDAFDRPCQHLNVLAVLGVRPDRAGFSVIPFDTEVGPGISQVWAEAPGREEGEDFASVLPGGDQAGLYSVVTSTEVLKLLARACWYIDAFPDDVELEAVPKSEAEAEAGGPDMPLPRIPVHRVRLGRGNGREDEA